MWLCYINISQMTTGDAKIRSVARETDNASGSRATVAALIDVTSLLPLGLAMLINSRETQEELMADAANLRGPRVPTMSHR